jgi:hypothetical protein
MRSTPGKRYVDRDWTWFSQVLRRRRRRGGSGHVPRLESLEARQVLAAMPIISELLASNDRVIEDVDGDDSDYIELYNAGDEDMSLNRYYLTDNPNDLQKWRLPDVPLPAGEYLLVFASNKDRNDPAGELHTNFALGATGEYLALVEPDGQTIAYEYSPGFPDQVTDVSYGVPTGIKTSTLVDRGAAARVRIPTDGSVDVTEPDVLAGTWLQPDFDDTGAGWFDATSGVGYVPPDEPIVLADSVADFSGVQGQDNWRYGMWLRNVDSDGVYAANEFAEFNAERFFVPARNVWDAGLNGAPPSTEITPDGGHPGTTSVGLLSQWSIRRWVSETAGEITISGTLANPDPAGDGVVARILVNGTAVFEQLINGSSTDYSVTTTVAVGDLVDFTIDAGLAENEVGDTTTFTASISGLALRELPIVPLADSSSDWNRNGEQGAGNWYFGLYDQAADPDQTYQADNFQAFSSAYWTGSRWEHPESGIDTQIRSTSMGPHAADGVVHWAVRRWSSTIDGTLIVEYDISKVTAGGDGATVRVFHRGVEVETFQIDGADRTGTTRSVTIPGVRVGDAIDFAIDPLGPGVDPQQRDGTSDRSNVDIRIARLADISENISTDLHDAMKGVGTSAYVRIPFTVADVGALDELTLRVKYDDGFIAYINGHRIAEGNAPADANYASAAFSKRGAEDATLFESFDISDQRGLFVEGTNVLQIHLLNSSIDDSEALVLPVLEVGTLTAELDQARYFSVPTPGGPNGLGAELVGPLIVDRTHTPNTPLVTEPLVVTATIAETFHAVTSVSLNYRVMYEDPIEVTMLDDGQGSDEVAGDGIYTAVIPAGVAQPGEMIRWIITARDTEGLSGRSPAFANPTKDEEYHGTIVADPTLTSNLPIYHWFVESPNRANAGTGTSGSVFYDGELYDNVFFRLHGQSSSGFPRKSFNVDFPNDHRLRISDDFRRMEDVNWLTNYADKSLLRNTLAYEQRAMTGSAYHLAFPIRIQQNGEFYAIYDFVEDPDERWLERMGYPEGGAVYKAYDTFVSTASAEKKTRTEEDKSDLAAVISGVRQAAGASVPFIMDNVNLAQMVNYVAGFAITSNRDCCHKNYYAFRDTEGTGEWWFLPWDVDLSQGRNWGGFGLAYFDDTMYPNNELRVGGNNELISRLYNNVPGFQDMFLRRVRTLMDTYIKPPGTPADELPFETRINELYELMKDDAALHNQKNPANWGQLGVQTFAEGIQFMLDGYVTPRRDFLYNTQVVPETGDAPVILSGEPGASTGKYFVPTDESLGRTWTQPDFDDSSWASGPLGIGFEIGSNSYTDLIQTDLAEQLEGRTSLYARIPFQIDDPAALRGFSLRMKYEDGYVAYINGVEVHRTGLRQDQPTFDSTSTSRSSRLATEFNNVNLSQYRNLLQPGENILAIHGLNTSATSNDMFFLPELVDGSLSSSRGEIPLAQVGNPKIDFGTIEFNPGSGNQQEEYIQLTNHNEFSVDLSGWQLAGDVEWTFDPGTVLPAGFTLYVTPDARAFRARAEGPTGGMGLFVQGNYSGRLPNIGGHVELRGADGLLVSEATYTGTVSNLQEHLRISEIMYNPLEASAAELAQDNSLISEDFEYIELVNISDAETLDLTGVRFVSGVDFDFTGAAVTQLAPGERVLVVRNLGAFEIRYGQQAMARVAGIFAGNTALRDNGEQVTLLTGDGSVVVDFAYGDNAYQGWPARADGRGSSLQIMDPRGDYQEPTNWRASSEINGSPGAAAAAPPSGVVINEILTRPAAPATDQVELYNTGNSTVSLDHYYLSDSAATADALHKYALPTTSLNAGAYLVLTEEDFNAGGGPNDFALSGDGEELYLTVGDANGPTHFVDSVVFGGALRGESFGRTPNGVGALYPALSQTFGATNSAPRVGPLVITELMAVPADPSPAALAIDPGLTSSDLEYIEIFNPTGAAVDLTAWRLRMGADFDFDDGTQVPTGQTLLVVPFGTEDTVRLQAFRAHYGLDESVLIVGGYSGQLASTGDGVQLQRAGTPPQNDPTNIPRSLEDEVVYDNLAPWPLDAFSGGLSLSRVRADVYGNDPSSWMAGNPTPGAFGGDIVGDLTNDGRVDVQDVEALHAAVRAGDLRGDLDGNGLANTDDMVFLIEDVIGTSIGDVDFDGVFDSHDLVLLFQLNEFEDGVVGNSTYLDGDWDLDGEFTSQDLLFALSRGGYTAQRAAAPAATPAAQVAAAVATELHRMPDVPSRPRADVAVAGPLESDRRRLDWAPHDQIFAEYGEPLESLSSPDDASFDALADELDRLRI